MHALLGERFAQRADIPFKEGMRVGVMLEIHHLRKINDDRLFIMPKNIECGVIAVDPAGFNDPLQILDRLPEGFVRLSFFQF